MKDRFNGAAAYQIYRSQSNDRNLCTLHLRFQHGSISGNEFVVNVVIARPCVEAGMAAYLNMRECFLREPLVYRNVGLIDLKLSIKCRRFCNMTRFTPTEKHQ